MVKNLVIQYFNPYSHGNKLGSTYKSTMVYPVMAIEQEESIIMELQEMEASCKSVIDYMNDKDNKSHLYFTMDSQVILFKIVNDHDNLKP